MRPIWNLMTVQYSLILHRKSHYCIMCFRCHNNLWVILKKSWQELAFSCKWWKGTGLKLHSICGNLSPRAHHLQHKSHIKPLCSTEIEIEILKVQIQLLYISKTIKNWNRHHFKLKRKNASVPSFIYNTSFDNIKKKMMTRPLNIFLLLLPCKALITRRKKTHYWTIDRVPIVSVWFLSEKYVIRTEWL